MRYFVLASSLGAVSACFSGLKDADSESIGTSGDTADSDSDSDGETTEAPSSTTNASGSAETTASTTTSATTTSSSTTDDSASESSTGEPEPSQCEGGPLPGPIPGCAPSPAASTGDPAQDCVDRINQFRWECQCLPPLARWADAEACSDQQSANDQSTNSPHGNFGACGESAQNTCPNWGSEQDVVVGCLQAMWDEGPGEPFEAHGHYINMSNTEYTKVACGFSASGGGVWANQNFAQ